MGFEPKTSALVSRRSWVRIPHENAYLVFITGVRKALGITVLINTSENARNPQFKFTVAKLRRYQ